MNSKDLTAKFYDQGFIGPVDVLTKDDCRQVHEDCIVAVEKQPPLEWGKGYHASSKVFYDLGMHPTIIKTVRSLIGPNIMLWGASMITRAANSVHPWHSDIESAATKEKTVSVWLGITHINKDSSLLMVSHSHLFGVTIQEERSKYGKDRQDVTNDDILKWAKGRDKRCELIRPDMTDGQALFFHGHMWHGSQNLFSKTRRAVILHYAVPQAKIRIREVKSLDFPFQQKEVPRPGCIMIKGKDKSGINRFVNPPVEKEERVKQQLKNRVYPFRMPLPGKKEGIKKSYPIFKGRTAGLERISSHISVLNQNQTPHAPHKHKDEEILMCLSGEVDLVLPEANLNNDRLRLKQHQFVYYPANFLHTIVGVSEDPATYLMFKWRGKGKDSNSKEKLPFKMYDIYGANEPEFPDGFHKGRILKGPTDSLENLQSHGSRRKPNSGYKPHKDPYDVVIVTLEGEIDTIGERVGPYSVIFYPAGAPHGLHNPGKIPAKYIVFEFHSKRKGLVAIQSLFRRG